MAQKEEGGRIIRPHFINKDNHPQRGWIFLQMINFPSEMTAVLYEAAGAIFAIVNQFIETDINDS